MRIFGLTGLLKGLDAKGFRMQYVQTVALAFVLSVTALGTTSCRTSRKGVRVGSEAASLKLQMVNLDEKDQGKANWLYELSGCTGALNGELGADDSNIVTFSAVGLKPGLTGCQFRIKVVSAPAGIIFAADAEQNVLYWTRDLELTSDATGQLSAIAGLQKLYQDVPSPDAALSFTLKVPVTFAAAEAGIPVTGEMKCNPPIANIGLYAATDAKSGVLTFPVAINAETPFACTQLFVSVAGIAGKYLGALSGDAAHFKGVPSQTTTTSAVAVTLQKIAPTPPTSNNVDVSTKPGECKAGEAYDTAKHACVVVP